jgi:hypothetical protein
MKKQLLTAILAITPFFAAAQPTNTELLVYLKQIRVDTKRRLENIAQHKQELKKRWYKNYTRAKKTWKNLYSFFEEEENKKWGIETDSFDVNIIYNQMKSLGTIHAPLTVTNELFSFLRKYTAPCKTTHHKVKAIIAKYFKDMTIDEFVDAFDNYRVISIIGDKPYFLKLLKKVDAKIAELEKQN